MHLPSTPSFRLDGKRALVTGASSGIGLGAAVALAEAGAHVVMAARTLPKLIEAVDAVNAKGLSTEALQLDVSDIANMQASIDEQDTFDILVNSAGGARHSPALETKVDDFDFVNDLNVKSAYFLTQSVAKKLKKIGKPGSLVNISSQMAHVGGIDRAVYCATKHAVEGFTKSMAMEFGPLGIRINTICPTFVRTPMTQATFDDPNRVAWIEEKIKLGRVGEIEDIMGAVVYLASDASSLVTGTSLLVDGGWTVG
ncbi:SDR family NAD(P)-dependent oxidoreductase [Lentilitoribacter sp. EG35]|uniref:SDR family NAD(P)-dependent oxidoreductase n=1 Tax=Lentilitoribacter sp. EG35 TaxID=3234192 RepID=UPI0034612D20